MILPGETLGLIGGGQLGRMFAMAARKMDYRVTVLDPDALSPAAEFATGHLNTPYTHPISIAEMAQTCAAITTEFENAPAEVLTAMAQKTTVRPDGAAVAIAQDRRLEKGFFTRHRFPTGPYAVIESADDVAAALAKVTLPAVLKTARFGYDGKGQAVIREAAQLLETLTEWRFPACVLEQFLTLECELSVVLARNEVGFVQPFPVAENQHINGVLDITIAPARVAPALAAQALQLATNMAMALNYVGVMAVEFFVVADAKGEQQLLINEIAPRPHNSGHFTMDACRTSQFEQQVRVLCGLPLGDASQHTPAVMLNLLGDLWSGDAHEKPPAWDKILQFPNAHLHLYGKRSARPGRKMGHVTVCGATVNAALQDILKIKQMLAEK